MPKFFFSSNFFLLKHIQGEEFHDTKCFTLLLSKVKPCILRDSTIISYLNPILKISGKRKA